MLHVECRILNEIDDEFEIFFRRFGLAAGDEEAERPALEC